MAHGVPSDLAGDDGAIRLLIAQFNLESGEGRVRLFNDRVDRPQVTLPSMLVS